MTELPAYQTIRRELVPHNPYFQQSLLESRRQLGIPELGFDEAVRQLFQDVPVHPIGFRTGTPDLPKLRQKAIELGLPLEDWLARSEKHSKLMGRNLYDDIEQDGWSALPIGGSTLLNSWLVQERVGAGLGAETPYLPPGSPLDRRLPSVEASMALVEQYGLGQDFVPSVASMILGCPPGGWGGRYLHPGLGGW